MKFKTHKKYNDSNVDDRYKNSDIKNVISKIEEITHDDGHDMEHCSMIDSRFINKNSKTIFFIVRSVPVENFSLFEHYYITFEKYEWHPGAPFDKILEYRNESMDESSSKVRSVLEMCTDCSIEFMLLNFERDKNFNILFNNCQMQCGENLQTVVGLIAILSTILFIFIQSFIILIILICALAALIISRPRSNKIVFDHCTHVRY